MVSTTKEKVQKKKNKLREKVKWCYRNSHKIPERYHILFRMDISTLCDTQSVYYLQQWIGTFQAYSEQAIRDQSKGGGTLNDEISSGTFDTEDLETEEYWIDANDGMDIEEKMADAGMLERDIIIFSRDGVESNREPKPPFGCNREFPFQNSLLMSGYNESDRIFLRLDLCPSPT